MGDGWTFEDGHEFGHEIGYKEGYEKGYLMGRLSMIEERQRNRKRYSLGMYDRCGEFGCGVTVNTDSLRVAVAIADAVAPFYKGSVVRVEDYDGDEGQPAYEYGCPHPEEIA